MISAFLLLLWTERVADEAVGELELEDLEELEVEEEGRSSSSVAGGVRGVVAVLDDGQEMDRCSCDLVKVSYAHVLNISVEPCE